MSSAVGLNIDRGENRDMTQETTQTKLKEAGLTAWRMAILGIAALLILVFYLGMAYLVYQGRMEDGPIILFTGVILGYLLRSVRDWV